MNRASSSRRSSQLNQLRHIDREGLKGKERGSFEFASPIAKIEEVSKSSRSKALPAVKKKLAGDLLRFDAANLSIAAAYAERNETG